MPGGRERSLLALLLIQRGEVVSSDRIVDALWGEHPPGTAAKAVQGYVSHLRRVLEPGREPGDAGAVLVTRPPGYVLRTDDVTVDAVRFERLAGDGRRALEDGSAAEAARLLDEALALWRGPALAEFAFDDFAQDEIRRLEELRLSATEDRIESLLSGSVATASLVGRLDALVGVHPLRERPARPGNARAPTAAAGRATRCRCTATAAGCSPASSARAGAGAPAARAGDPGPGSCTRGAGDGRADRSTGARRGPALHRAAPATADGGAWHSRASSWPPRSPPWLHLPSRVTRLRPPWRIVAPAVVAVDPATNHVVASIGRGLENPCRFAAGEGGVWVGDARDGTVTRIDPVSRRVAKTIGIGAPAVDLATGAGGVWVATWGFGTVVHIDPELGAPADPIELGDPGDPVVPAASSIGVTQGRVWVGALNGLVSIDPESGRRTGRVDLGRTAALQMAAGYGAVWVTTIGNRAKRVEASSAKQTTEFYAGTFVAAIARDRSAVWVGAGDSGQV